jgi:O-antigen ligase
MIAAAAFVVLAISIVFLTVSGGGLFPATVGITAAVLCATACFVSMARSSRPGQSPSGTTPRTIPYLELTLAGMLLFVMLSAIPLPPALDVLSGPLRHSQNQAVVTALHEAGTVGVPVPESTPWFALTRNRAGTLRFFLLLAAAFGAALIAASLPPSWKTGHLHSLALIGAAVGIAGYLGQWIIPQGDSLWWFIPLPPAVTKPVGCFLNRNHFGGFVAMLTPVALALAHHAISQRRWLTSLFYLPLTGVMMAIVFLSLSRGAMLAMAAGLSVTAVVIAFRHRALWGILLLALMLAGATAILARTPAVRERLEGIHNPGELNSVQSRLAEWRESLRVWPDYPVFGAGMNALRTVYPQRRQTSVGARLIHAENEYIQLLAEGGLIGVGLSLALLVAARRRIRDAAAPVPEVILIAVTGALTVTGVHCLVDFPAHLPLYALVLGSLAGLLLPPPASSLAACLPAGLGLLGAAVLALTPVANLRNMDDPTYLYTARYKDLHRALVWAPTSSAWLDLGRSMFREGANRESREICVVGEKFMTRAAELDPRNYRLWQELGNTRASLRDYDRATDAFRRAHELRSWLPIPTLPGKP